MPHYSHPRFHEWQRCQSANSGLSWMPYQVGMVHPHTGDYSMVVGSENVRANLANGYKILDTPRFRSNMPAGHPNTDFINPESLPLPYSEGYLAMSPTSTVNDTIAAGAVKEYDNPSQVSACTITSNQPLRATNDGTTTPTATVGEIIPINTPIALRCIPNAVKGLKIRNNHATNAATITIQYFTRGDL